MRGEILAHHTFALEVPYGNGVKLFKLTALLEVC